MIGCLLCETPPRRTLEDCRSLECNTVTLKLRALSDKIEVSRLQNCFETSGLRKRLAKQMADQVADLGVAEVVLPRVDNRQFLMNEIRNIGLIVQLVSEVRSYNANVH